MRPIGAGAEAHPFRGHAHVGSGWRSEPRSAVTFRDGGCRLLGRFWLIFREEETGWGARGAAGGGKKWKIAGKRSRVWPRSGCGVEGGLESDGEGRGG